MSNEVQQNDSLNVISVMVGEKYKDYNLDIPVLTKVDVATHTSEMLEMFGQQILADRPVHGLVRFFHDKYLLADVICRYNDADHSSTVTSFIESLMLFPVFLSETAMIGHERYVDIEGMGQTRCIVISTFNDTEIFSQVFPISVTEDSTLGDKVITWDHDAKIVQGSDAESKELKTAIAFSTNVTDSPVEHSMLVKWLGNLGHEISFHEPVTMTNIANIERILEKMKS